MPPKPEGGPPPVRSREGFQGARQPDGVFVAAFPCHQEGQIQEGEGDARRVVDLAEQLQGLERDGPGLPRATR